MAAVPIHLDRAARTPLATQIYRAVRDAIEASAAHEAPLRVSAASPA
ncbi:hypothetical protein NKJ46_03855 [Mesorhizobium sp. M0166]